MPLFYGVVGGIIGGGSIGGSMTALPVTVTTKFCVTELPNESRNV